MLELVGHALVSIERMHSCGLDRGDVHKRISRAVFRLDEAIAFVGIEEFYGANRDINFLFLRKPTVGSPVPGAAKRRKEGRKAPETVKCD